MYSVSAYALAWLVVEIPYVAVETFLFVNILYWTCHFSPDLWRYGWFLAFSFLYMLFATAFGQLIAGASPTTQVRLPPTDPPSSSFQSPPRSPPSVFLSDTSFQPPRSPPSIFLSITQCAQTVYNTIAPLFSIMSGMTFMPSDIPKVWWPLWVLCPLNKAFEGTVMTQWYGDEDEGVQITVFNSDTRQFETKTRWGVVQWFFGEPTAKGFSFEHRWRDLGVLCLMIVACNVGFGLALKYRKLEKR